MTKFARITVTILIILTSLSIKAQDATPTSVIFDYQQIIEDYARQSGIDENPNAFAVYFDDAYAGYINDEIEIDPANVEEISIIARADGKDWFSGTSTDQIVGLKILSSETNTLNHNCIYTSGACQVTFALGEFTPRDSIVNAGYGGELPTVDQFQVVKLRTEPSGAQVIIGDRPPYWKRTDCEVSIPIIDGVLENVVLRLNGKSSGSLTIPIGQNELFYDFEP